MRHPQSYGAAMRAGAAQLRAAGIDTPPKDARALLLAAAKLDPQRLIAIENEPVPDDVRRALDALLDRRVAGEPVARIVGRRSFYGLEFRVTPDVLDPRADSETLVDAALDAVQVAKTPAPRVLDLGTGSGCLLLSFLANSPNATGLGVDRSEAALTVARDNAKRLDLADRAVFLRSEWLEKVDEHFDLVVCNPPYLRFDEAEGLDREVRDWDPKAALFAGEDGLEAYRELVPRLSSVLKKTGLAVFEVGYGQASAVAALLADAGFRDIGFRDDLSGICRCVIVR